MTESKQKEITNRLYKLEKQNRHMKAGGLIITLLFAVLLLMGAKDESETKTFKKIVVERIVLVDTAGKLRGSLGTMDDRTIFQLYDSSTKIRLQMTVSDKAGMLIINDSNEKNRLYTYASDKQSGFGLKDSNEKKQLILSANDDNNGGFMTIYNKTNEEVVQLSADEYGNGNVGVFNRKGKGKTLTPGP